MTDPTKARKPQNRQEHAAAREEDIFSAAMDALILGWERTDRSRTLREFLERASALIDDCAEDLANGYAFDRLGWQPSTTEVENGHG